MTPLLFAHHVLSVLLAIVCWWVAHEYAKDRPPGRLIAIGWSLVGLTFVATAFIRHHAPGYGLDSISWGALMTKVSLLFTEACVIIRFVRRRQREDRDHLPRSEAHPPAPL